MDAFIDIVGLYVNNKNINFKSLNSVYCQDTIKNAAKSINLKPKYEVYDIDSNKEVLRKYVWEQYFISLKNSLSHMAINDNFDMKIYCNANLYFDIYSYRYQNLLFPLYKSENIYSINHKDEVSNPPYDDENIITLFKFIMPFDGLLPSIIFNTLINAIAIQDTQSLRLYLNKWYISDDLHKYLLSQNSQDSRNSDDLITELKYNYPEIDCDFITTCYIDKDNKVEF